MKSTRLRIQKYHPTQLWRAAQRPIISALASFILLTLVCSFAAPLTKPHLISNQVRASTSASHLNGVQVVVGSNPATPTIDRRSRLKTT